MVQASKKTIDAMIAAASRDAKAGAERMAERAKPKLTQAQAKAAGRFKAGWCIFKVRTTREADVIGRAALALGRSMAYMGSRVIVSPPGVGRVSTPLLWAAVDYAYATIWSLGLDLKAQRQLTFTGIMQTNNVHELKMGVERLAWIVDKFPELASFFADLIFVEDPAMFGGGRARERFHMVTVELGRQIQIRERIYNLILKPETVSKAHQYAMMLVRAENPVSRDRLAYEIRVQVPGGEGLGSGLIADIVASNLHAAGLVDGEFTVDGRMVSIDFPQTEAASINKIGRRFSETGVR